MPKKHNRLFLSFKSGKIVEKSMLLKNNTEKMDKKTAYNKRFGASGGVTSNNLLWGIDRLWF